METSNFLKDKTGKFSAMRLALFVYLVPVIATWAFICLSKKELLPLDNSLITGLGLFLGGKSIQHFSEAKDLSKLPKTE